MLADPIITAASYHEETKHYPHRFARSPRILDWANQPDPFRRYAGAPLYRFAFPRIDSSPPYDALYDPRRLVPRALDAAALGEFFESALGLSARKEYRGASWELRCNPSSGNLHPTEGYLVAGPAPGLSDQPGVYHYAPKEHGLEQRCVFSPETWKTLAAAFPAGVFFAGLTSIHWREAWKYGERAYRYCNHDVGHALASMSYSAAALGWRAVMIEALGDSEVAALLGVDRVENFNDTETEHPDVVIAVFPVNHVNSVPGQFPKKAIEEIRTAAWQGHANRLSARHVNWDIIARVAQACVKPRTSACQYAPLHLNSLESDAQISPGPSARQIFQQRRSAQAMDESAGLSQESFYRILERIVHCEDRVPWWTVSGPPQLDLVFFVHRVHGLTPGIYAFGRTGSISGLKEALDPDFLWEQPPGCPPSLPFYLLRQGDCRQAAIQLCCGQEIAGHGVFSLAMLARFQDIVQEEPWEYPRLFWEAGMIGQVLYLEAEAAGVRGTGIGCYFDDAVHDFLGLRGTTYQSLYHFTVGKPVLDPRLRTLSPYSEERRGTGGKPL